MSRYLYHITQFPKPVIPAIYHMFSIRYKTWGISNISAKSDRFEKLWYLGYLQSRSTCGILNISPHENILGLREKSQSLLSYGYTSSSSFQNQLWHFLLSNGLLCRSGITCHIGVKSCMAIFLLYFFRIRNIIILLIIFKYMIGLKRLKTKLNYLMCTDIAGSR